MSTECMYNTDLITLFMITFYFDVKVILQIKFINFNNSYNV